MVYPLRHGIDRFAVVEIEGSFYGIGKPVVAPALPNVVGIVFLHVAHGLADSPKILLGPVDHVDGVVGVVRVAPRIHDPAGVRALNGVDRGVDHAVFVAPDFQDSIEHLVQWPFVFSLLVWRRSIDGCIELAQARHGFAAVGDQSKFAHIPGRVVIPQQVVVAETTRVPQVPLLTCHPVHAARHLEYLAIDLGTCGRDSPEGRVDGSVLPHIVEDPDHAVGPGALAEPLRDGQQTVLHIFAAPEDDRIEVRLGDGKVVLGERPCIRHVADPVRKPALRLQHVEHAPLEQFPVGHRRGHDHEWVVVCGAVLCVPNVTASLEVPWNQARA